MTIPEANGDESSAGSELVRAVEFTEGVKRIVIIATHINRVAINAILLARRAGDLARGFGVLSRELRVFTRQVTDLMDKLSTASFSMVGEVSSLLRQGHSRRLLTQTQDAMPADLHGELLRSVLQRYGAARQESLDRLRNLKRELATTLDEAFELGQFGAVLARTARIEVTYAGAHTEALTQVAKEFDETIRDITISIEQLRRTALDSAGSTAI